MCKSSRIINKSTGRALHNDCSIGGGFGGVGIINDIPSVRMVPIGDSDNPVYKNFEIYSECGGHDYKLIAYVIDGRLTPRFFKVGLDLPASESNVVTTWFCSTYYTGDWTFTIAVPPESPMTEYRGHTLTPVTPVWLNSSGVAYYNQLSLEPLRNPPTENQKFITAPLEKMPINSSCYDIAYTYWITNKWGGNTSQWGECSGIFGQSDRLTVAESYNHNTSKSFFEKYTK
jgi:hypothetical protein